MTDLVYSAAHATAIPYRRTLWDCAVCAWRACWYQLAEPALLRRERALHASAYSAYADRTSQPLISVMLPTYKRAALLVERTLPPILSQTYANIEVIVVGDRTVDDTEERIKQLHDARVRFIHVSEESIILPKDPKRKWFLGGAVQRNVGLKETRGTWIVETDDDDIFTPDHIETLLAFAREHDYEFVSAQYERERHGVRDVIGADPNQVPRVGGIQTWLYRSYLKEFSYNYDCWRKSFNCPQEIDRQIRMHRAGVRMGFLEKVVSLVLPLPGMDTVGLEALEIKTGLKLR